MGLLFLTGQSINRMYLLEALDNLPNYPIAMSSLSQPTSLKQWHQCLTYCSPLTIKEMASKNLVNELIISETAISGKCEDCIMGHQTCQPFDGITEKNLNPVNLITIDLWGPSH